MILKYLSDIFNACGLFIESNLTKAGFIHGMYRFFTLNESRATISRLNFN